MKQRRVTIRLKYGKRGFYFIEDGAVNRKSTCYYTRKSAAVRGVSRHIGDRPHTVSDETGRSYRNNPK